jgi:hypothetical protein
MVREGFIIGVSSAVPELTFCCGLVCAGGIYGSGVAIIVENSSVVGNTAAIVAGGIYVQSRRTLRVTSTTVTGNRAADGYGGTRRKKSAKTGVVVL